MSKDDDEYKKLYNLLASLSSKVAPRANPIITPMISIFSEKPQTNTLVLDIPPIEPKVASLEPKVAALEPKVAALETEKVLPQAEAMPQAGAMPEVKKDSPPIETIITEDVIPVIESKAHVVESMITNDVIPAFESVITNVTPKIDNVINESKGSIMESLFGITPVKTSQQIVDNDIVKQLSTRSIPPKKPAIQSIPCDGCTRSFASYDSLYHHHTNSRACAIWYSLEDKTEYMSMPSMPLHNLVDEILYKTLCTEEEKYQCRTCHVSFSSNGNLHKHLITAITCNRIAYARFKKIVSLLT